MAKPNFILPNKPAIKAGSILSYNYTDDLKFAAEPLDFSRNGSATRVNKQGLIETTSANISRIDYSDSSTEPSLLLEPQSTNLFPYSNDFSQWGSLSGASVINNVLVSPDGTLNADEFVFDGTNNGRIEERVSITNGLVYTFSIYLKNKDIANPTQVFIGNETASEGGFVTVTNEWQRFTNTQTVNETNEYPRVRYDGVGSLYAYGAQFEQKSFATSYIPTLGSTATRLGETADNAGGAGVFNSEEGVLYVEIAALANDAENRHIEILSKSDESAFVRMKYGVPAGRIECQYRTSGSSTQAMLYKNLTDSTEYIKIAFKWQLNNFSLYINGTKISEDLSGNVNPPNTFDDIRFGKQPFAFYGKTKNLQVFNYALTDEELQTLTT